MENANATEYTRLASHMRLLRWPHDVSLQELRPGVCFNCSGVLSYAGKTPWVGKTGITLYKGDQFG